jgi:hypothetical protein
MFFYAVFLVLFTVTLLSGLDDDLYPSRFVLRDAAAKQLQVPAFLLIRSELEFWTWLNGPLVDALGANKRLSNATRLDPLANPTRFPLELFFAKTGVVGDVRLVQKRVEASACRQLLTLSDADIVWGATQPFNGSVLNRRACVPKFTSDDESKSPFGPSSQFVHSADSQADINAALLNPDQDYGPDGFIEFLPMPPRGGNATGFETRTRAQLSALRDNDWVDELTSAVFVDLTLFTPGNSLFCAVRLMTEWQNSGGVQTKAFFRVHKLLRFEYLTDALLFAVELVVDAFVLYYITRELRHMLRDRCAYWKKMWNILEVMNLTLFLCVIVMRAICDRASYRLVDEVRSGASYVHFHPLAYTLNQVQNISAFNAVLSWIKVFKYLGVSPNMSQLTRVLAAAARPILVFSLMFVVVYFGFATSFYLAFSVDLEGFKTLNDSFFSLFRSLLGDFDFNSLEENNAFLGPLLFTLYIFLVVLVMLNMFLAIINDAYAKTQSDLQKNAHDPFAEQLAKYFGGLKDTLGALISSAAVTPLRANSNNGEAYREKAKELDQHVEAMEEMNKFAADLQLADKDQSKTVSKEEIKRAVRESGGLKRLLAGQARAMGAGETDADTLAQQLMSKYDANKDQELDEKEIESMQSDLRRQLEHVKSARDDHAALSAAQVGADRVAALEAKIDRILALLAPSGDFADAPVARTPSALRRAEKPQQ